MGILKLRGPAHEVVPGNRAVLELEAPVRSLAGSGAARDFRRGQCERRAVVDPGLPALLRESALEVEFLCALEAGIEQARGLQALRGRRIAVEPRRLSLELVPVEA